MSVVSVVSVVSLSSLPWRRRCRRLLVSRACQPCPVSKNRPRSQVPMPIWRGHPPCTPNIHVAPSRRWYTSGLKFCYVFHSLRIFHYVHVFRQICVNLQELCNMYDVPRARENFRGCLSQSSLENLGQILTAVAISGWFKRFLPGQNGFKVGCQSTLK